MTRSLFSLGEQDTKLKVINYTVHRNADYHYSPTRQSFRNDTRVDEHTRAILLAASTFSGSSFTSDINVSIKGRWEKLEQSKEITWREQEGNASHRTRRGEARDDLSGIGGVEGRRKCW